MAEITDAELDALVSKLREMSSMAVPDAVHFLTKEAADAITGLRAELKGREAEYQSTQRSLQAMHDRAEKAERELADWNALFVAVTMGDLPEPMRSMVNPPIKPLWPNEWHQDCAAVAFFIKNLREELRKAAQERDKAIYNAGILRGWVKDLNAEAALKAGEAASDFTQD